MGRERGPMTRPRWPPEAPVFEVVAHWMLRAGEIVEGWLSPWGPLRLHLVPERSITGLVGCSALPENVKPLTPAARQMLAIAKAGR